MATLSYKKTFRWHLLAWLAFVVYSLASLLVSKVLFDRPIAKGVSLNKALWLIASFTMVRIIVFYYCYLLVFPYLLRVVRLPLLLLGLGSAVLVFAAARAGIEEVIYPALLGFHNYTPDTTISQYLFDSSYYTVPNIILSAALWSSEEALRLWAGEEARRHERENQQLTTEKRAAEAAFLKTQINPHFLHNTLNMLYGMAYPADKPLAHALLQLSELMRYMLRETPDNRVELRQEIEYLENFLALYRLRYPGQLHAALTVDGDPAGHRVAPLLLIPFVENAFKHGVLDDPATPVRMHLTLRPGTLAFTVANQCHHYQPDATSGIGLTNLQRRLELLYEGRYTLRVGAVGGEFQTHLWVNESENDLVSAPRVVTPKTMARRQVVA